MNGTFWLGVYPGLTTEMLDHVIRTVREFVANAPLGDTRSATPSPAL